MAHSTEYKCNVRALMHENHRGMTFYSKGNALTLKLGKENKYRKNSYVVEL